MLKNLLFSGIPYITDCVMAEIEKLGSHYRVALRYFNASFLMLYALERNSAIFVICLT